MKKFTITLFLFAAYLAGFSQDVNIYWGNVNKVDRFAVTHLIGKRGNYLLAYKQTRRNISMLKYNFNNLQVSGEYPILGKFGKDMPGKTISDDYLFHSMPVFKNHIYITVTQYDRKTKENSLCMQEIDDNGKLSGTMKKLETLDAKSKFNRGAFSIVESDDSTRFMLLDEPPYEKYAGEKYTITLYDESLNQTKKLSVELPFKDKYFDLNDITYADDGNIYMMARVSLATKEKEKGEASYYYELIAINTAGDGSVVQYDIKLQGKFIDGISFDADDDKDIICSGFYGNNTGVSKGDISGIFYMRLNKTTKQVDVSGLKDLDKDFIADITSAKKANKGKGISNDFKLKNFIRRSDGGSILVAEYSSTYTYTVYVSDGKGGGHTETHTAYCRDNIIAININPDGSIKWYANIPKKQETTDDGAFYSSYMLTTKGDKLYFVYNDNPDNLDPKRIQEGKPLKNMGNALKSEAVLVELSEDGQYTKKALFSNKDNKMALIPSSSIGIGNNQVIVPAYNGGVWCCFSIVPAKSKLARFEFK